MPTYLNVHEDLELIARAAEGGDGLPDLFELVLALAREIQRLREEIVGLNDDAELHETIRTRRLVVVDSQDRDRFVVEMTSEVDGGEIGMKMLDSKGYQPLTAFVTDRSAYLCLDAVGANIPTEFPYVSLWAGRDEEADAPTAKVTVRGDA